MKARVKATGRVIEVINVMSEDGKGVWEDMSDVSTNPTQYHNYELDFIDLPKDLQYDEPGYWERLKHQYAGMAMQQMVNCVNEGYEYVYEETAIIALNFATALVNKLKEDSQCEK